MTDPVPIVLTLPFRGRWLTQNSPARRVPSHGTELYGTRYAIDFVPVDDRGRSAPRGWQSWLSVEPPESFVGFGAPILSPADGTVVVVHDGEEDHVARRSTGSLLAYALGQAGRIRQGPAAIAGNHVIIALDPDGSRGPYVGLVHLRRDSLRVRVGDHVRTADRLGDCGNSGNSTEPHVHVQVTDSLELATANGLPLAFRRPGDSRGTPWVPHEAEIVEVP